MALHLIKLCVGCDTIADLRGRQRQRLAGMRARGEPPELKHTTRMAPKRAGELLAGGSLYWVIKGLIQARQKLVDIRQFRDAEGIGRCDFVLGDDLIPVAPRPHRAFQGWRYYLPADAPPDLTANEGVDAIPEDMRRDLAELGLL